SLSQEPAARLAARLLAARRRPAGERSRLHAPATPRFLRHRMGHHESALAHGARRAERRAQRRHGVRRQRQLEGWNRRDPRLKASVVIPYENGEMSRAEIRKRAGDRRFAHVLFLSRTSELLGKRRYWPIFEAAVEAGFPIGVHVFGSSG